MIKNLVSTEPVPTDSDNCTSTAPAEQERKEKYKLQNTRGFALLLLAIYYTTDLGDEFFYRVNLHHSTDYAQGNFKTAWLDLMELYDSSDLIIREEIKEQYYGRACNV